MGRDDPQPIFVNCIKCGRKTYADLTLTASNPRAEIDLKMFFCMECWFSFTEYLFNKCKECVYINKKEIKT